MYGFLLLLSGPTKPKMHTKTKMRPGRKGHNGRRVRMNIKKKSIVMKKHYKSGKEKDNKLMKKFANVQETQTLEDTKVKSDSNQLINLDMVSGQLVTEPIFYIPKFGRGTVFGRLILWHDDKFSPKCCSIIDTLCLFLHVLEG